MAKNGGSFVTGVYRRGESLGAFLDTVDAVIIATPISSHYELCRSAIMAGKDVLCEKPIASTLSKCLELIELAKRHGVKLMAAHTHIHSAEWQKCSNIGNLLGMPLTVRVMSDDPFDWLPHACSAVVSNGGGDVRALSGESSMLCTWGKSLVWYSRMRQGDVSPMKRQLDAFLSHWEEDLEAVYRLVFKELERCRHAMN